MKRLRITETQFDRLTKTLAEERIAVKQNGNKLKMKVSKSDTSTSELDLIIQRIKDLEQEVALINAVIMMEN